LQQMLPFLPSCPNIKYINIQVVDLKKDLPFLPYL
jgi:hypothetical protein